MGSAGSCCEDGFAAEGDDTDDHNHIGVTISGGCVGSTSYGVILKSVQVVSIVCNNAYVAMAAGRDISEEGGYYFPASLIDQTVDINHELGLLGPEIHVYDLESPDMQQEYKPGVTKAQAFRAKEVLWYTSCGCRG